MEQSGGHQLGGSGAGLDDPGIDWLAWLERAHSLLTRGVSKLWGLLPWTTPGAEAAEGIRDGGITGGRGAPRWRWRSYTKSLGSSWVKPPAAHLCVILRTCPKRSGENGRTGLILGARAKGRARCSTVKVRTTSCSPLRSLIWSKTSIMMDLRFMKKKNSPVCIVQSNSGQRPGPETD